MMMSLKEIITKAEAEKKAVGHFNISDSSALKGIFEAARKLNLPVLIGTSEGERDFLEAREAVALVKELREEYDYPIFLNADHTHSLAKVKEALEAGYDAILFDGGRLPLEENIKATKEAVDYVRATRPGVLIEGEMGYIGTSSEILKEIPKGAAVTEEDMTKPDEAERFVRETGVDLLAPAVGNIHGMLASGEEPRLDIGRIGEIKARVGIPLVLHGGSGTSDDDFREAIKAGISVIHINTEIRKAWREGLEEGLKEAPDEVAPYKLLDKAVEDVKRVVEKRLKLFSGLS